MFQQLSPYISQARPPSPGHLLTKVCQVWAQQWIISHLYFLKTGACLNFYIWMQLWIVVFFLCSLELISRTVFLLNFHALFHGHHLLVLHVLTLRLFLTLRGITGFFQGGVYITLYVLTTEFVGPKHRSFAGTMVWMFYTSSLMLLSGLAYGIRDWRTLSIVISAPAFPLIFFWWWVNSKAPGFRIVMHPFLPAHMFCASRDGLGIVGLRYDVNTGMLVSQFLYSFKSCFLCAKEENCAGKNMNEWDCWILRMKQLRNRETTKLNIPVSMSHWQPC